MRVVVVGLIRDNGSRAIKEIMRLQGLFSTIGDTEFFVVESDSSDNTVGQLASISMKYDWFTFESFGELRHHLPIRTMRIAHCRNRYVEEINRRNLADSDLVVAVDLDIRNDLLSGDTIARAVYSEDWDVLTANQLGRYYDIWALRHPQLSPNDYRSTLDLYQEMGMSKSEAALRTLYARMISIPPNWGRIQVLSAFGGLALYRPWVFQRARYEGLGDDGREVSEHVPFNLRLVEIGARIFIESSLITTRRTEHSGPTEVMKSVILGSWSRRERFRTGRGA